MTILKEFFNEIDFDFSEVEKSFEKAKNAKEGSLDRSFAIDELFRICKWFLNDAARAIDNSRNSVLKDVKELDKFEEHLLGILSAINIPFSISQINRKKIWSFVERELPILFDMLKTI